MSVNISFCFAIVLALNSVVNCEHFCTAFRDNSYRISYLIRDVNSTNDVLNYYLFISGQYWIAKFEEGSKGEPTLQFDAQNSTRSGDFFGGDYHFVFWINFKDTICNSGCPFAFKSTKWGELDVGTNGKYKDPLQEMKNQSSITIKFDPKQTKPDFGFSEHSDLSNKASNIRLVFITKTNNVQFEVIRYDIQFDNKSLIATKSNDQNQHLKPVKEFNPLLHLIGVHPQWSNSMNSLLYMFLFRDRLFINWCFSEESERPQEMESCKKPEVLVDCSAFPPPTPTTDTITTTISTMSSTTEEEDQKDGYLVLIVIVVLVVVIFVILILIVVFCCRSQKSEGLAETPSSIVRQNTARSGIADSPKSEAGKKTSQAPGKASIKPSASGSPAVASSSGQNK